MPRYRADSRIALVCAVALAAAVAGCKNSAGLLQDQNDGGWFSKPVDVFAKPDWARPIDDNKGASLGPKGPVGPDDLVGADGRCVFAAPETAQAAAPPVAADANPEPSVPTVVGGIALGMTECQAVQRAGTPGNVAIGAGDRGERSVVLTYLTGTWPGIYRFADGRLKVIDRAPAPPEPPKAPPKKKTTKKPAKKPAA